MTTRELSSLLRTQIHVEPIPGLRVLCHVIDAKQEYGHTRLQIEPVAGTGQAWVNLERTHRAEADERCSPPVTQKPEGR